MAGFVTDYSSAQRADTGAFGKFFRTLLERGIYFPPSQFEAAFLSLSHNDDDIAKTLEAAAQALTSQRPQ